MNTKDAINNLELMSAALSKSANKPENYNTDWAFYLEQMSFQMNKQASELRDIEYKYGISQ